MILIIYSIKDPSIGFDFSFEVNLVDHSKVQSLYDELIEDEDVSSKLDDGQKRKCMFCEYLEI